MGPDREGMVMFTDFKLEGQWFAAMDSAREHGFKFNEAVSFIVFCEGQEDIDYYWEKLSAVPEAEQCGWNLIMRNLKVHLMIENPGQGEKLILQY
jgi:predicted 3-demethylubiquinone-9 3-methyltransferase (glyoxalase superfamily)